MIEDIPLARPAPATTRPGIGRSLLVGAVAGLVGGLLLTTVQASARLLLGVPPPAELIADRVAVLLSLEQFGALFTVFSSYNEIKQAGVLIPVGSQLTVGVLLGIWYALRARRVDTGRSRVALAVATTVLWALFAILLWPNLATSHLGLDPLPATITTLAVTAAGFALFALAVFAVHRLLTPGSEPDRTVPDRAVPDRAVPDRTVPDGTDPDWAAPVATSSGRRALLVGGVGVGLAAATAGLGTELYRRAVFDYDGLLVADPMSPITPVDKFYIVTKNLVDPDVAAGAWNLTIGGAARRSPSWSLDELRAMPMVTQETTLMCISNPVGGGLESNAMWTGVPLARLIEQAGPRDGVVEILVTSVDGYSDSMPIAKATDPTTLLAFEMNGVTLPRRHGYPARLVVPGMFGEKNVKWVNQIELVTYDAKGFYEKQGWGPNFVIPTRSRITSPIGGTRLQLGRPVELTGTALGGDRGISRVEVSADGGASWKDAEFTYPGSRMSWTLWRFGWRPTARGDAALMVRATDGTGQPQITEQRSYAPQGATGLHSIAVTVV